MELIRNPIYQQLHNHLRQLIREGSMKPGSRFMSEREISDQFEVSRVTANKVLSSLVGEGLLEFRRGIGTFVAADALIEPGFGLRGFTANVTASGRKPRTKVVAFHTLRAGRAPKEIAEVLRVAPNAKLIEMKRLRLADDVPMILEHRFLNAEYCPGLKKTDLESSLFAIFSERYHLTIMGSEESVRPVVIDEENAKLLQVEGTQAGFLIRSVGFLAEGQPLWIEETLHRPDGFEFRCRAVPAHPARELKMKMLVPAKSVEQ